MRTITNEKDGTQFDCAPDDTILRAALRAGLGMSYSCNVGSCGNCRFELVEGEVRHARNAPPAWSERDLKRNRWLGCQAVPQGDCRIKFRADPASVSHDCPDRRTARLQRVTPVTRDISEIALKVGRCISPARPRCRRPCSAWPTRPGCPPSGCISTNSTDRHRSGPGRGDNG